MISLLKTSLLLGVKQQNNWLLLVYFFFLSKRTSFNILYQLQSIQKVNHTGNFQNS